MKYLKHGISFCIAIFFALLTVVLSSCDWELSQYTVSYYTNRGTRPESITLEYGTKLGANHLPELEATGWDFGGWFLSTDKSKEEILPGEYEVKKDITLCALWRRGDKTEISAPSSGTSGGSSGTGSTSETGGLTILIQ